jgi:hypothetical protein
MERRLGCSGAHGAAAGGAVTRSWCSCAREKVAPTIYRRSSSTRSKEERRGKAQRSGARTTTGSAGMGGKARRAPASGRSAGSVDFRGGSVCVPSSGGPRPREARPRATHCAWVRGLARATSQRGAARHRPTENSVTVPLFEHVKIQKVE